MEIAGRYTLEREVGRGGMGAVWLGTDLVLGRQVALKRIGMAPGVRTPDLERAEREAQLAARLNHPHVVAVFDLVVEGDDHWLVMEYVEGRTLSELVRQDGALTPDQAAPLISQAAAALAAAHESGIVHRDVKASNILVTPDGQVKLSDFGIARAEADASLTQTGLVTGSPAYLAPEVASGQLATPAADVWSLGATTFHALAGRPPYDVGDNVMGALYRIVHEDPPRLADAGWLGPLLDHTMTKDPAQRWPMSQVRDFLEAGPVASRVYADPVGTRTTTAVHEAPPPPAPAPPLPPESTQVLAPALVPEPTPAHRRGPGGAVIGALAALAVVLLFLLFAWLFGAFDPQDEQASEPPSGQPSSSETTREDPSSSATQPAADQESMQGFITDYVALAVDDPRQSWDLLTPEFQQASGSFGQYQKFWNQWESATVSDVQADVDTLTVSYSITYVRDQGNGDDEDEGEESSDTVTLVLERDGNGGFLIAAER
jgi:serine/threonine protein kinase